VTIGGIAADRSEAFNPKFFEADLLVFSSFICSRLVALARAAAPKTRLPESVFAKDSRWVVNSEPCHVIEDLGRYIRRCLPHVLPSGVHRIRDYGLWSPAYRPQLRQTILLLASPSAPPRPCLTIDATSETARGSH
jgi:hypothetical protein